LPIANGNDGCESTGATITSSTIIPSAKPPEKHMPTAPMPLPPTRPCTSLANARNQPTTGEDFPIASVENSRETQILAIDDPM
jgi:hypothetical protein